MSEMQAAVLPVTPLQQNCSLIWCAATKKAAVIDPGGDVDEIVAALGKQGLTLEKVLLTHGHFDHAGGAAELAEMFGVPVEGPQEEEKFLLDVVEMQGFKWGVAGGRNVEPDRWLTDGDTVTVGELTLDVIHTPGHTPGHVVFFHAPSRFAIVGDVLFKGSIGRTDFPRGDHDTLIRSIKEKLLPLGDDVTFLPGHGPLSTFGNERRTNPFLQDG
ncbi:MAG TPA: MBL fold metallo-hydrolase [Hyphomicrobiales bacterium]|nr:MBL fold metallo-hydrolase [Hyphomicrobiales bacterium]